MTCLMPLPRLQFGVAGAALSLRADASCLPAAVATPTTITAARTPRPRVLQFLIGSTLPDRFLAAPQPECSAWVADWGIRGAKGESMRRGGAGDGPTRPTRGYALFLSAAASASSLLPDASHFL